MNDISFRKVWPAMVANLTPLVDEIERARKPKGRIEYLTGLGRHAIKQIQRLAEWENDDIDKVAWAVRNLYEIRLQIGFIFKHDDGAEKLSWLQGYDYSKVIAGLNSINPTEEITRWHANITESLKDSEFKDFEGYKHFKRMADFLGDTEYDTFYRMLSVLTHPSLYLVAHDKHHALKPDHLRTIILGKGAVYGAAIEDIYKAIVEAIRKHRKDMPEQYEQ